MLKTVGDAVPWERGLTALAVTGGFVYILMMNGDGVWHLPRVHGMPGIL